MQIYLDSYLKVNDKNYKSLLYVVYEAKRGRCDCSCLAGQSCLCAEQRFSIFLITGSANGAYT